MLRLKLRLWSKMVRVWNSVKRGKPTRKVVTLTSTKPTANKRHSSAPSRQVDPRQEWREREGRIGERRSGSRCQVTRWATPSPAALRWRIRSPPTASMSLTCTHHFPELSYRAVLHGIPKTKLYKIVQLIPLWKADTLKVVECPFYDNGQPFMNTILSRHMWQLSTKLHWQKPFGLK